MKGELLASPNCLTPLLGMALKYIQTHRHREQICGCQGGGGSEGEVDWDWTGDATSRIHRMDEQQSPTVQHNHIQYSRTDHNGKEY